MKKLICDLLLVAVVLFSVNGCKPAPAKTPAKPDTTQNVWLSATPEAVSAAQKLAVREAKENFALLFYSTAAENKVELFHSPQILSAFNDAWKNAKVTETRRNDGSLHIKVEYAFSFGACQINDNFRFISAGIKADASASAFAAAKQGFLTLLAAKILALKIPNRQTIGDLLSTAGAPLRNELALYLFRVSKSVPGMPRIKCLFSSGGGYNERNQSANWSGMLPYDPLLMDLAIILKPFDGGSDYKTLKKYNPALPKQELLNVKAFAADLKRPADDELTPETVFAAGFAALDATRAKQ